MSKLRNVFVSAILLLGLIGVAGCIGALGLLGGENNCRLIVKYIFPKFEKYLSKLRSVFVGHFAARMQSAMVFWGCLVQLVGRTTAGFMEVFSPDLRQCLLPMDPTLEFS